MGNTPAGVKVRLGNVKASYFTGSETNRATLEQHICSDISAQVGTTSEACSVTAVKDDGKGGMIVDISLSLESDSASSAAANQISEMSSQGALDMVYTTILPGG